MSLSPIAGEPTTRARRPEQSPVPPWLLKLLAVPAAIAVWSGWVGVGQMTGFGEVQPLPGVWSSLHVNTAVTLPIGVEVYAVLAMRVWLSGTTWVSGRTKRFACWSAIGSLVLGMAGQACYHLLAQSGATRAPWQVTTLVSCIPVLFLGLGGALAHMLSEDTTGCGLADQDSSFTREPDVVEVADPDRARQASGLVRTGPDRIGDPTLPPDRAGLVLVPEHHDRTEPDKDSDRSAASPDQHRVSVPEDPHEQQRLMHAQTAAAKLASSGRRISRRILRAAGVRGSNADLAALARMVRPG